MSNNGLLAVLGLVPAWQWGSEFPRGSSMWYILEAQKGLPYTYCEAQVYTI